MACEPFEKAGETTVLPAFIIDQIRRREREQERRGEQQPVLEVPTPSAPGRSEDADDEEDKERGVLIIDLG